MSTVFVQMYHPLIPSTTATPVRVPQRAVDDYAARGWLEVDPSDPPVVVTPYLTQAAGDSRYVRDTELGQQTADAVAAGTGPLPGALKAALVTRDLPAHAGSRTRRFEPAFSIYNRKASNTRRLRAARAAARAGTGLCRTFWVGDSVTAGLGGTRGTSDPVTYARGGFTRDGYTPGEIVHGWTNLIPEPRLILSGGADGGNGGSSPTRMPYLLLWASGHTITHTGVGTVCEIVTTDGSGSYTYKIDGGTAVTVSTTGTTALRRTAVTGLTNASHTVVITSNSSESLFFYAAGFRGATGIVVENGAVSGSTATDWITGPFGGADYSPGWSAFSGSNHVHDAVIIELGLNDYFQGISLATFRADLGTLVDQAKTGGATVILVASNYPQDGDTTWQPYVSAIYDVADSKDVPLIDLADRFGTFAQYDADGLGYDEASDNVHLTPAGYAHKAAATMQALTA